MKFLARLVVIVLLLVVLAWAGAEYLLVRQARQAEAQGRISFGATGMLTDPARIGGRFSDVVIPLKWDRQITVSEIDLWVPPLALNAPHASLPARIAWGLPGDLRVIEFAGGVAQARFSPFRDMALTETVVQTDGLRINGEAITGALQVRADLTNFGAVIPKDVAATYRVQAEIGDLNLPALARMLGIGEPSQGNEGRADITGPLTLWLSSVPGPRNLERPEIVGVTFDGLQVDIDGAEMQIWGQLARDPSGKLSGELALDSAQLREFVMALAHAGYMPLSYAPLAATALITVSRSARLQESGRLPVVSSTNLTHLRQREGSPYIPPRPEGVERIPLRIEAGQIHVGEVPLSKLLGGKRSDP